ASTDNPALRSYPTRRSSDLARKHAFFGILSHTESKCQSKAGAAQAAGNQRWFAARFFETDDAADNHEHSQNQHRVHSDRLHNSPDRKSTRLNSSHLVISYAV